LLADLTGIDVVHDMRANDMVHGGQGAPLVPAYHQALAAGQEGEAITAFVNIGGIANVTFVGAGNPVAFDTGPGNALIDQWVQANAGIPFDDGGRIASEGAVDEGLVSAFLDHGYFKRPLPKSLDRNDFSPELVAGLELSDGARTLAAMTARSIIAASVHAPASVARWIICGGGRRNSAIITELAAGAGSADVMTAEDAGLDGGAMEAEAWAYLAVRSLKGLPITFPLTTGVKAPVTGGVLSHPRRI
jgi:anhydro-N-acetylmuramic acid kinase